jgi:hypothetical protein
MAGHPPKRTITGGMYCPLEGAAGQWRHTANFTRNKGWTMSKVDEEEQGLVWCSDIIHKGGHRHNRENLCL